MGLFQRNDTPVRRPEDLITRLCRESGRWLLTNRSEDQYWVRANDTRALKEIMIRYRQDRPNVLFQAWFPVRFPLDNPPSGLFARLLLRNIDLHFAAWAMVIGESCEACPTVTASIPRQALDASLLDFVCREIRDEILGFHKELHNKFAYSPGPPVLGNGRDGQAAEVRYIEPDRPALPPAEAAWRMLTDEEARRIIRDQAGPGRYQLPGKGS